jgi:hypothetical protein
MQKLAAKRNKKLLMRQMTYNASAHLLQTVKEETDPADDQPA